MIAQGASKNEAHDRHITLNESKPSIEIGRSSNNPLKGLEASTENAMIDSPIMSRSHARFSMTKRPVKVWKGLKYSPPMVTKYMQGVELEDLGSTHGTYIAGRRLASYAPYQMGSGDDIQFGCEVVNGESSYIISLAMLETDTVIEIHPAKTFQVFYDVKQGAETDPASTSNPPNAFRVPDTDDESIDSEVENRDPSVEIVDSIHRSKPFSVPSTDDEDSYDSDSSEYLEGEENAKAKDQDTSAVTTPEAKISKPAPLRKNSDIEKLLNKDAPEGSSQQHPIEVDKKANVVSYDVLDLASSEDDSDDDYAPREPEKESSAAPSPPARPHHPLSAILNEQEHPIVPSRNEHIIPETQRSPSVDEDFLSDGEIDDAEAGTDYSEEMSERSEGETEDRDFDDEDLPPFVNQTVSKVPVNPSPQDRLKAPAPAVQRTPSPSDAAMAKRAQYSHMSSYPTAYGPFAHPYQEPTPQQTYWPFTTFSSYQTAPTSSAHPTSKYAWALDNWPHEAERETDNWGIATSVASNFGSTKTSEAGPLHYDKPDETAANNTRLKIDNLINVSNQALEREDTQDHRLSKRKADEITNEEELKTAGGDFGALLRIAAKRATERPQSPLPSLSPASDQVPTFDRPTSPTLYSPAHEPASSPIEESFFSTETFDAGAMSPAYAPSPEFAPRKGPVVSKQELVTTSTPRVAQSISAPELLPIHQAFPPRKNGTTSGLERSLTFENRTLDGSDTVPMELERPPVEKKRKFGGVETAPIELERPPLQKKRKLGGLGTFITGAAAGVVATVATLAGLALSASESVAAEAAMEMGRSL